MHSISKIDAELIASRVADEIESSAITLVFVSSKSRGDWTPAVSEEFKKWVKSVVVNKIGAVIS